MARLYIAGPYTAPTPDGIQQNIEAAREVMVQLIQAGHTVFCPHTHTAHLENEPRLRYEDFIRVDLEWLRLCEGIVLLPNWQFSPGSRIEHEVAEVEGLEVYEWSVNEDRNILLGAEKAREEV